MRKPIFVRTMQPNERQGLLAGLRSSDPFTLRRCQILLASAEGQKAIDIARNLHCDDQTVRNAIHDFNAHGLEALTPGSHCAHTLRAAFDATAVERLRALLHQSPRTFGHATSLWTLELAAKEAFTQGLTDTRVTGETVRATLQRQGISWRRAKRWITSPDPEYARKKNARDRLIRWVREHYDWALGFLDETWWSRFVQPYLHAWSEADQFLRLIEQTPCKDDADRKALACYGLLLRWYTEQGQRQEKVWVRFVDGRPVSAITVQFLEWCCSRLQELGKRVLALIWDNASWHISRAVRSWIRAYNRQVKRTGQGVRILVCRLPIKSPWLNPIEPKWVHSKRCVVEPERTLSAQELADRVCALFDCEHEPHLSVSEQPS